MTLEQLRVFVAVAERQHMTRAAETLHLAQSAVSHAIAALEGRYGTRLFDRVGRRIVLTEPGHAFLLEARAILAQVEHAELALGAFGKLERGTLNVHASQTIAGYWLPHHLVRFHQIYPGIEVRLAVGNTAQVAETIETGAAELGFVEGVVESASLASTPVARDRLVVVVGPAHPWAQGGPLAPARLAESQWVLREPGSGTRSAFERALAALGVAASDLPVAMVLPSNEAVRGAVEAGLGATAISASVAASSLEAGLLCQAGLALPDRAFHALRHQQRFRSRAADALLAVVREAVGIPAADCG